MVSPVLISVVGSDFTDIVCRWGFQGDPEGLSGLETVLLPLAAVRALVEAMMVPSLRSRLGGLGGALVVLLILVFMVMGCWLSTWAYTGGSIALSRFARRGHGTGW